MKFSMNFSICNKKKKCHREFDRNCIEFVGHFGEY